METGYGMNLLRVNACCSTGVKFMVHGSWFIVDGSWQRYKNEVQIVITNKLITQLTD